MSYPPLLPITEVPIHGFPLRPGAIFACESEDELDDKAYDWRCEGCVEVAEMDVETFDDPLQSWRSQPDAEPQKVKLSWLVARSQYWFGKEKG